MCDGFDGSDAGDKSDDQRNPNTTLQIDKNFLNGFLQLLTSATAQPLSARPLVDFPR